MPDGTITVYLRVEDVQGFHTYGSKKKASLYQQEDYVVRLDLPLHWVIMDGWGNSGYCEVEKTD